MGKYYTVNVNFCGFIGCDEEYIVYADSENEALEEARELAIEDLYCTVIEDDEDEEDE